MRLKKLFHYVVSSQKVKSNQFKLNDTSINIKYVLNTYLFNIPDEQECIVAVISIIHIKYSLVILPVALTFLVVSTMLFLNASYASYSNDSNNLEDSFHFNRVLTELSNPNPRQLTNIQLEETSSSYNYVGDTLSPSVITCQGATPCLKGQVVKVLDGKSFYVSVNNKIYKVDLALIGLPVVNQQAMIAATTFTRNSCLGSTVLIDQDDGQKGNSIIGTVYCSPTKSLNAMLLDTGYVQLDTAQCLASEFSKLDWAKSRGC